MKYLTPAIGLLTLIFISPLAIAEKWINVGSAQKNDIRVDIYADSDSSRRKGDIATIKWKAMVADTRVDEMAFDCEKNYMYSAGKVASTVIDLTGDNGVFWSSHLMRNMQGIACKKSYEFWK
jgi:hypothetical protein